MVTTNQKFMIHTHKRERNPNITLKTVIKTQGKRAKEDERNKNKLQEQTKDNERNGNKYILINNYFKCKWTKCLNQKTQAC